MYVNVSFVTHKLYKLEAGQKTIQLKIKILN